MAVTRNQAIQIMPITYTNASGHVILKPLHQIIQNVSFSILNLLFCCFAILLYRTLTATMRLFEFNVIRTKQKYVRTKVTLSITTNGELRNDVMRAFLTFMSCARFRLNFDIRMIFATVDSTHCFLSRQTGHKVPTSLFLRHLFPHIEHFGSGSLRSAFLSKASLPIFFLAA
jgi:hypothetical protein